MLQGPAGSRDDRVDGDPWAGVHISRGSGLRLSLADYCHRGGANLSLFLEKSDIHIFMQNPLILNY